MHAAVIAGTHSGVGKTTVTLGLLAALQRRKALSRPPRWREQHPVTKSSLRARAFAGIR